MSIPRVSVVTDCYTEGRVWQAGFRKAPLMSAVAGAWTDLSMATGTPKPNYYLGTELTSTVLNGTYGLFHGGAVSPREKFLHQLMLFNPTATSTGVFLLLDYLLYYPVIDMDSTDEQTLVNTVTLPRYVDGDGVQAFLVATNPYVGGSTFFLTYTNQDGELRHSQYETSNATAQISCVIHGGVGNLAGPFIRTARSDRGIRSVQSITFLGPNGGLAALVLAKPLTMVTLTESTTATDMDFLAQRGQLPRIHDGAYLGLLGSFSAAGSSGVTSGLITTLWN